MGKADSTLSVTPKNEWDIAAGVLLVTEGGGVVTNMAGQAHRFNQRDTLLNGVIAASSAAHKIVREIVMVVQGQAREDIIKAWGGTSPKDSHAFTYSSC